MKIKNILRNTHQSLSNDPKATIFIIILFVSIFARFLETTQSNDDLAVLKFSWKSNFEDQIVPQGGKVKVNFSVENIGGIDAFDCKYEVCLCEPQSCEASNIESCLDGGVKELEDSGFNLQKGMKKEFLLSNIKADEVGYYEVYINVKGCYTQHSLLPSSNPTYSFQTVTLDGYQTFKVGKDVRTLTWVIIVLTILVGILTIFRERVEALIWPKH